MKYLICVKKNLKPIKGEKKKIFKPEIIFNEFETYRQLTKDTFFVMTNQKRQDVYKTIHDYLNSKDFLMVACVDGISYSDDNPALVKWMHNTWQSF